MMIHKRLIHTVRESKKYIAGNVIFQWISLTANISIMGAVARMLQNLQEGRAESRQLALTAAIVITAVIVRFVCAVLSSRMGYLSSKSVKKKLRQMIYEKLLRLGASYNEQINTSEIVQVAVEGVEQLETYFGAYLPQLFYAMLAPLTLFVVLSFVNFPSAIVLLVCVPLIPVTIAMIQKWAKKLLSKYWSQYTALGDTFLENLQGLTTTKIYQADAFKHKEMNEQSEHFRRITMKVLKEKASNLSGGQRQRLALARALLHDSPVYIFDEATSNIDVESENDIMAQIYALAKTKTVILISQRLANVTGADTIYVLEKGSIVEEGAHESLLGQNGIYARLWNAQQELESYGKGGNMNETKRI